VVLVVLLPEQILFAGKFDAIIQCFSTYLGNPFAFSDSERKDFTAYEKPASIPTIFFGFLHTRNGIPLPTLDANHSHICSNPPAGFFIAPDQNGARSEIVIQPDKAR
jgi:hypothetical protein